MKNNWSLQREGHDQFRVVTICVNRPGIGADIESDSTNQFGTVVGIISNKFGDPVCYKVWCRADDESDGCFDYIPSDKVSFWEPCLSVQWSLGRIGYCWVDEKDDPDGGYFYNKETEDIVSW